MSPETHYVTVDRYVESLPPSEEIRERLSAVLREGRLLRQILKLSEQRQKVREARQ